MTMRYLINRFLTPISIMDVGNHGGLRGLYLFGIRMAVWPTKH